MEFSHLDESGRVSMVDVSAKKTQLRVAKASGSIKLDDSTLRLIEENKIAKGSVLTIAEIAGIQAAKRTSELIPLCHPLQLTKVDVKASVGDKCVAVESKAVCVGQTGVEMEALTAVSVALLTIYDMCKAVDKNMVIQNVELIEKTKNDI